MIIEIKYSKNLEKYSDILKDILKKFKLTNKGIYRQYITTIFNDDGTFENQDYNETHEDITCIETDSLDFLISLDAELTENIESYSGLFFQSFSDEYYCIKIISA